MKKLACLMVVAVLLAVSMIPCFAASGINDCEQKIITYVKTAYVVDGKTITVPAEYITALENVFTKVDVTESQYNEIKAVLDEALAYCKANNLTKLEDITAKNAAESKSLAYEYKCREEDLAGADEVSAVIPAIETKAAMGASSSDATGYFKEGYAFSPMFTLGFTKTLKDKEVFSTWLSLEKAN